MKQIPTPQLIRIIDPALVPIASPAPKMIDLLASEAFVQRPRRRIALNFPPRILGQHQTASDSSGVGVATVPT